MASQVLAVVPSQIAEVKMPTIAPVNKVSVWRTSDGVYHETADAVKAAVTEVAIAEFARINNANDVATLTKLLAANLSRIKSAVDTAVKSL